MADQMLACPTVDFDPALLSRIEDAGLNASAPREQRWIDGWLVRFSPGKAKRARCINAVAEGRTTVAQRLEACAALFESAELPLIVRVTPFSVPLDLDEWLALRGFHRFDDTRVMVLSLGHGQSHDQGPPLAAGLSLHGVGLEAFAQRVGFFRGSTLAQRQAHAARLAESPVPFFAFELRSAGETLACGQIAIEGDIAGIYDVFTPETARGRGHASALCAQLIAHARQRGAAHLYLQVESDNLPARAVYRRLGFRDAYAYHYRAAKPAAA